MKRLQKLTILFTIALTLLLSSCKDNIKLDKLNQGAIGITGPIAIGVSPPPLAENSESMITLTYNDDDDATACSLSNLNFVTETTACACAAGVCTVGVTGLSNYNGTGSFDFSVTTPSGTSSPAAANFTVSGADDAPVSSNISPSNFNEDTESIITLNYSDPEFDQATTCSLASLSNVTETTACSCSSGVCTVGVTGTSNYFGAGSFDYTVTANSVVSNTSSASFTMDGVDDAPVSSNITPSSFAKDTESIITLSYSDAESDAATTCSVTNLSNITESTACSCAAGTCTVGVTGSSGYSGAASFDYTVTANSAVSNTATASLTITNDTSFITVWRMGTPSYGDGDNTLTLPVRAGFIYNFTVDWGDGDPIDTVTSDTDPDKNHTYAAPGDYTVTITGTMEALYMSATTDGGKLIAVNNLGTLGWKNMRYAFLGASKLTSFTVGTTDTSNVTDMMSMFNGTIGLTTLDLTGLDTSSVTTMNGMFSGTNNLLNLDVSNFNTSNVVDMSYMFYSFWSGTSLDLSSFDTSNVTNMYAMFRGANGLTSLDLSNFITTNVVDMENMFSDTGNLTSLDISSFNTANVTNMSHMFDGADELTSLDLSHFDTSQVTNMESMFESTTDLVSLNADNWDVSAVTNSNFIWSSTNAGLVVICDQGGSPATGSLFGETCN